MEINPCSLCVRYHIQSAISVGVTLFFWQVPEVMTDENWLHALQLDSKSKRMRYYTYLRKVENAKKSKRKKQEQKVLVKQQQQGEEEPVERGENAKSTIFFTIRDSTIKKVKFFYVHQLDLCWDTMPVRVNVGERFS